MPSIVKVDQDSLNAAIKSLEGIKNGARIALLRSINKATRQSLTATNRAIRQEVRLPQAYVASKIAQELATYTRLRGRVKANTRRQGTLLSYYLAGTTTSGGSAKFNKTWNAWNVQGVHGARPKVRVSPKGAAKPMPYSFVMTNMNGGITGIVTKTAAGKIQMKYGPAPWQVFISAKEPVGDAGGVIYLRELERQTDLLLSQV